MPYKRGPKKGVPKPEKRQGNWRLSNSIREEHGQPIYTIQFNFCDLRYKDVFATVGSNQVNVYQCLPGGDIELLLSFVDEEKEENYFTCAWSINEDNGHPYLCVAGQTGVIKIIDCTEGKVVKCFTGHGNCVNELQIHPKYPQLVVSASKDESLRLWNIRTETCVIIFAGMNGHRNEIISADFHLSKDWRLVSCGVDSAVKIWDFSELSKTVMLSMDWTGPANKFPTKYMQYPSFTTQQVHMNYIDCVCWLGDLILSKSVENCIVLWRPEDDPNRKKDSIRVIQEYSIADADIWFMKFALDFRKEHLVMGNRVGKVFLWSVGAMPAVKLVTLCNPACTQAVRQAVISHDAETVLACCEDGSFHRWDRVEPDAFTPPSASPVPTDTAAPSAGAASGSKDATGTATQAESAEVATSGQQASRPASSKKARTD